MFLTIGINSLLNQCSIERRPSFSSYYYWQKKLKKLLLVFQKSFNLKIKFSMFSANLICSSNRCKFNVKMLKYDIMSRGSIRSVGSTYGRRSVFGPRTGCPKPLKFTSISDYLDEILETRHFLPPVIISRLIHTCFRQKKLLPAQGNLFP